MKNSITYLDLNLCLSFSLSIFFFFSFSFSLSLFLSLFLCSSNSLRYFLCCFAHLAVGVVHPSPSVSIIDIKSSVSIIVDNSLVTVVKDLEDLEGITTEKFEEDSVETKDEEFEFVRV